MNASVKYPDFFARFYDIIYEKVRDKTDHNYFLNKIKQAKGPVLEVGVGTGRFFTDALDKDADIYGIDISPSMIDILKQKLNKKEHRRVSLQDLRELSMDKKFDLIIAPFRVFMHIISVEDQLQALNKVFEHLVPGGQFIFDLFVPDLKLLLRGLDNVVDFEGEYEPGKKLKRITSMKADIINQFSHVTFKLVWDEEGKEVSKEWKTDLRFFFRYEIEHLIHRSKLQLIKIYGDFNEHELNRHSKEFIVVCKRPD